MKLQAAAGGVAEWVFKNQKPAGRFTETLPQADGHYIPLTAAGGIMGVLCIQPDSKTSFTHEQEIFLKTITYQISLRFERENLAAENQKTMLVAESERIYKILLNSISHELRTPLTTITGASTSLLDDVVASKPEIRNGLINEIHRAGGRLNRLVDNLLDMSRLESGMMKLNLEEHDAGDLIDAAIRTLGEELSGHKVVVDIPDGLPMIHVDFVLMEQALINLIYNAANHTPSESVIVISEDVTESSFKISVSDNGRGLIPDEIPFLFDKFHRGASASPGGTGLGLSICKGIVEAHKGIVTAANNPGGGAQFVITLPLDPEEMEHR